MDEMINALTSGIGSELWKPIRLNYYMQKRRFFSKIENYRWPDQQLVFLCDLIALAVFNELVIVPLQGSLNFIEMTSNYNIPKIKMGEYELGNEYSKDSRSFIRSFFAILHEYGIGIDILSLSDSNKFVEKIESLIKKRQLE